MHESCNSGPKPLAIQKGKDLVQREYVLLGNAVRLFSIQNQESFVIRFILLENKQQDKNMEVVFDLH